MENRILANKVYLVFFKGDGDIHRLEEEPTEEMLVREELTYIRFMHEPEKDYRFDFYSIPDEAWVKITA